MLPRKPTRRRRAAPIRPAPWSPSPSPVMGTCVLCGEALPAAQSTGALCAPCRGLLAELAETLRQKKTAHES
jgi:hypothetical protein